MADKDKRIVYQGENGIAVVVIPDPNFLAKGNTMDNVLIKCVPENCRDSANVVEVDTVPSDRTFRNSWVTSKGKSVEVDLDKAKVIAKEKVREARVPKFQELDIAYQRADEGGEADNKKAVADKKKVLRDSTANTKITYADSIDKFKEGMEAVIKEVGDL